jgi:Fe-S cluster biosynthesis and repair protein YggX
LGGVRLAPRARDSAPGGLLAELALRSRAQSSGPRCRRLHSIFGVFAMSRTVHCVLLKEEAPGLDRPPYPGELGKRIYENVSKAAWQKWVGHQTMLINEYRLTPVDPKARKFLEAEMEKFFFGQGSDAPADYVPPK